MLTKFILLFTLIGYSIIVSQSFMYLLALKKVSISLDVNGYIVFRKLVDASMTANFKYVIYFTLLINLLLVIVTFQYPFSIIFICSTIAFAALIVDTMLTVKGNLPINSIINTWTADNHPSNWETFRNKWLTIFQYRQMANLLGFTSLLIGVVFG